MSSIILHQPPKEPYVCMYVYKYIYIYIYLGVATSQQWQMKIHRNLRHYVMILVVPVTGRLPQPVNIHTYIYLQQLQIYTYMCVYIYILNKSWLAFYLIHCYHGCFSDKPVYLPNHLPKPTAVHHDGSLRSVSFPWGDPCIADQCPSLRTWILSMFSKKRKERNQASDAVNSWLGGGFKYFLFSSLFREMIQFD